MSKSKMKKLLKESELKIPHFLNEYSEYILNEEASIFVGTGLSMNSGLPGWKELLAPCFEQLNIKTNEETNLYKIAQYYANDFSDSILRRMVNEQINKYYESNDVLKALLKIKFKSIWTTNYDKLIEKEFENHRVPYNVIYDEKNLSQIETGDKVNIYKINGDISSPNNMVLTQEDFERYEDNHSLFLTFLKKELVSNSFMFIGYSFDDQVILNCLSSTMKLLDNAGNRHYALIYIDENVTSFIEYKAKDLKKRYNIECIYVNKNTLLDLIYKLNKKIKENKVFISGAYYHVSYETDFFADALSKELVKALYDNNYRISTGIGRKLGTYITGYADQYLAEKNIYNIPKYLTMRPFPFHLKLTDEQKNNYRTFMQHDCCCAIFMFGQSEHEISTDEDKKEHKSLGVYQEYLIAKKLGLVIIPIGSTGYESEIIWKEVKANINQFYYLDKKIDKLMEEKDPKKIADLVIAILNSVKNN